MSKDYTIELCSHHCLKIIYGIVRCTIGKIYSAVSTIGLEYLCVDKVVFKKQIAGVILYALCAYEMSMIAYSKTDHQM